ncbi:hypothetical protein Tco_0369254 [Tanacetum coccineum]
MQSRYKLLKWLGLGDEMGAELGSFGGLKWVGLRAETGDEIDAFGVLKWGLKRAGLRAEIVFDAPDVVVDSLRLAYEGLEALEATIAIKGSIYRSFTTEGALKHTRVLVDSTLAAAITVNCLYDLTSKTGQQ